MKDIGKFRIVARRILLYASALITAAIAAFLIGCAANVEFSLSTDEIGIYIGETRDIKYYAVFDPSTAENRNITLVTQSDCVEIDGTKIIGVKKGVAVITVKSDAGEAALTVNVRYRDANNLTVTADNLYQTVQSGENFMSAEFAATMDDYADPDTVISWTVNGKGAGTGSRFCFTPNDYGEYDVCATAGELVVYSTVKVYRETTVTAEYSGSTVQTNNYTAVRFSLRENIDTRNPYSVYEWSVNGEPECDGAVFEFTPAAAGSYEITLKVNGKTRKISGAESVTVSAAGKRAPCDEVVFDDGDGAFVKWADGGYINRVSIIAHDGSRINIDRSDAQHAYRFERGAFKLDGLIDICAQTPVTYTIVTEADGISELEFTQYPIEARKYLDEIVLCGNKFISSDDDGQKYIAELYACGIQSSECYIARDAISSAVSAMSDYADKLGLSANIKIDGSIATIEFSPYVNKPEFYSSASALRTYAVIPHIEYSAENRRAGDYVLALDRSKKSAEVQSSEQLLYAAKSGVRPVPVSNSTAAIIYSAARNKLLSIIGADYTDEQKLLAIYDWLQWVTVHAQECDENASGRFLESVFGSAELTAPDATRAEAVTSEGAAKAFCLLASMEGIPCAIVSATVDDNAYFWNKVQLRGLWYNIDLYGGEIIIDEIGVARQERPAHRRFLISDAEAAEYGLVCSDMEYSSFDESKNYFLRKFTYADEYFDYYIDRLEKDDYSLVAAAVDKAFGECKRGGFTIPFVGRDETYMNSAFGAEFEIDAALSETERNAVLQSVVRAANEYAENVYGTKFDDNAVRVYTYGNFVQIAALIPTGV